MRYSERLLPRAEVERMTGFKRSAIYARIAAGTFPAPLREPGTGTVRWLESEVVAWIEAAKAWPRGGSVAGTAHDPEKTAA
jgi:prophage regulatory protein